MVSNITVVISQTNSRNPKKREFEETIAQRLSGEGLSVTVVPNLYDLKPSGEILQRLQSTRGNLMFFAWNYPRATHWVLDRNQVRGHFGEVELGESQEDEWDDDDVLEDELGADEKVRVADEREIPDRTIFCFDLNNQQDLDAIVSEARRIIDSCGEVSTGGTSDSARLVDWIQGDASPDQLARYLQPTNDTAGGPNGNGHHGNGNGKGDLAAINVLSEATGRRWYPVIDFSRCTNCMECIDFCLFGVYGVDQSETILVEQPDNCRKGCPACSRVCPENAIIFPQHKTPGIAGAPVEGGSLKIDLSQLFGAPDAQDIAARERDEQLILAGRAPVAKEDPDDADLKKRQEGRADKPRDELDSLIDGLDDLD